MRSSWPACLRDRRAGGPATQRGLPADRQIARYLRAPGRRELARARLTWARCPSTSTSATPSSGTSRTTAPAARRSSSWTSRTSGSGEAKDPFADGGKQGQRRSEESRQARREQEAAARDAEDRRERHRRRTSTPCASTDGGELDPELEVDGKKRHP